MRIGIDLGGTKIAAALIDEADGFRILDRLVVPCPREKGGDAVTDAMASLVRSLMDRAALSPRDIDRLGIAAPGIAAPDGRLIYSCNLPYQNEPLADRLKALCGIDRVTLLNDANAAALGEATAGAGKGVSDLVMITLGTGIGGGILAGGRLVTGFNAAGAELGHTVIVRDGRPCTCGRRGCFEAYCSAPALLRDAREAMAADPASLLWDLCGRDADRLTPPMIFEAQKQNDACACRVIGQYIGYLACGVTNMVNLFQPAVLCLGGGLSGAGEALVRPLREIVLREQYARDLPPEKTVDIRIAELQNDAGLIGAAAY